MAQNSDRPNGTIARLATRERLGAGFLLICAAITGIEAAGLQMGTSRTMGPGYFPWILTALFAGFALILLGQSRRDHAPLETGPLRPVLLIIAAVAAFGLLLPITGAAVAVVALVVLAALAETGRRPLGVLALALVLVVLVWLVFRLGLNLQLPMLPGNRG